MEQQAVYDAIQTWCTPTALGGLGNNGDTVSDQNPLATRMHFTECPSETGERIYYGAVKYGTSNYVYSGGDWQDPGHLTWLNPALSVNYGVNPRAVFNFHTFVDRPGYLLSDSHYKSIAHITDGTSNAVAVSESCQGNGNAQLVKVGVGLATMRFPNRQEPRMLPVPFPAIAS